MKPVLLIGIGNPLRGDDGVGPAVAHAVAALHRDGVRAIAVHQLTPDLAADLAAVDTAILVDADVAATEVTMESLDPAETRAPLGHHTVPSGLLHLALAAYGRAPETWLLRIPAVDFDTPDTLSPQAAAGLAAALSRIDRALHG